MINAESIALAMIHLANNARHAEVIITSSELKQISKQQV